MDATTDRARALLAAARKAGAGRRKWIIGAGLLVAVLGLWLVFGRSGPAEPYRTAEADRGRISRVVSATGALQPLVSVNVGSTVSGLVQSVEVDFNSRVRAGQVLARLEPDTFQQRVDQAQASVRQANADLAVAQADYSRYAKLDAAGFASAQLMNQQRAARERAAASVSQAAAQLETARVDLNRSIIRAPIDGVIVDRQINPGQSVAASFQAPTLFIIAQDLSSLQANISVDEADIGDVHQGQRVRFSVDAFPDDEFEGEVSQVRQQGVDTNGVVSYTVVVRADNPQGRLLPGMTANAEIIVQETEDVARIPNAALRFRPTDERLQQHAAELVAQAKGGARQQGQAAGERQAGAQGGNQGGGWRGGGQGGGQGAGQQERLADALKLTDAQRAQMRQAMQTARASQGGQAGNAEPGARRAAMRRMREAALTAIEPTLTAEQRQLLAQFRAGAGAGPRQTPTRTAVLWVLRNNQPTPVRVELGVADDTYTELRGGDLRDGDKIITGGGPQNTNAQQKQRQQSPFGGGGGPRIRGA
ncbi:MAG: efflux RND transporter periplasmic adaptor subunit [Hyphomonadaceae bacterium]|nr:efflux RND transporter periplasmic adaptor subunit [Hyphomonadaceae bacterium]